MKTLGMIGGTTWLSTLEYYRMINQEVNRISGEHFSARLILYSLNFQEVLANKRSGNEKAQAELLTHAAKSLKSAGAEGLILCANTTHKYADEIRKECELPLLHIAEVTGKAILEKGIGKVALLGTQPTMEEAFYKNTLEKMGVGVLVPDQEDRLWLDQVIFEELAREQFRDETRSRILSIINYLEDRGAAGAILGCTELPLIISSSDTDLPLFDTLRLHADAAAQFVAESS